EHSMNVKRTASIRCKSDITVKGCNFYLLAHRNGQVILCVPIEIGKQGVAERADGGKSSPGQMLPIREFLKTGYHLVPGFQNEGERLLSIVFGQQAASHARSPSRCGLSQVQPGYNAHPSGRNTWTKGTFRRLIVMWR